LKTKAGLLCTFWKHPGSPSNYNEFLRVKNTKPPINALFANCQIPKHGRRKGGQDSENFSKESCFLNFDWENTFTTFATVQKRWAKSTNDYSLKKILLTPIKTVIGKVRVNFGYNSQTDRKQSMKTS